MQNNNLKFWIIDRFIEGAATNTIIMNKGGVFQRCKVRNTGFHIFKRLSGSIIKEERTYILVRGVTERGRNKSRRRGR